MNNEEHKCIDSDQLVKTTKLNIEKFGLQVIMVNATSYLPSFAYSIGLWETYKQPEIICFGLSKDLRHGIINDVAELMKGGGEIVIGKINTDIFKDSRAIFLKVDKRSINDYFGAAQNYYKDGDFDALQLVWTDLNDRFPWEENFEEEFLFKQPLLDRNADFKFYESQNLATFTTRQWVEDNKPIVRVVHDDDGDWQFLTGDQMPEDIKIVALKELISRDNTLNELFDLEYSETAERESINDPWIRNKIENDKEL